MQIPRCATPPDVCDELERAIESEGTSDVVVNAVHLRGLVEDARTLRGLIEADIPALVNSPSQLAQLLAQGRSDTEVAQITGYSLATIAMLKSDPTFAELVADYQELWMRQPGKPD